MNNEETSELLNRERRKLFRKSLRERVELLLRSQYLMGINTAGKIAKLYFAEDFLPNWYFHANSADEIAKHIYIITQKLDPDTDHLEQASDDGKGLTYFLNVGHDYPGRLLRIVEENLAMGIVAYDSVKTRSGIYIISLEKRGRDAAPMSPIERAEADALVEHVRTVARAEGLDSIGEFLACLTDRYLTEELNSFYPPRRVLRHARLYDEVIKDGKTALRIEDTAGEVDHENERLDRGEIRIYLGRKNADADFCAAVLRVFAANGININRSYFDTFEYEGSRDSVGIVSAYVKRGSDIEHVRPQLEAVTRAGSSSVARQDNALTRKLEHLVEMMSSNADEATWRAHFDELRTLCERNRDTSTSEELGSFLLNSLTDFLEAAEHSGLAASAAAMRALLRYDGFDEFYIGGRHDDRTFHVPGFRMKHNSARGIAYKGGLRIDPIVEFTEVAALSFMMTWKCARSRILFGGAKGGLMLSRSEYVDRKLDFFDTLTDFGRSLFLVTGPTLDVPAGDVGCGPEEIGHMFEGFKSALRELALAAFGVKQGMVRVGNRIISAEQASEILRTHFGVDYLDERIMERLTVSEHYLELVAAAQITGKPRMGIAARAAATGKGLCYALLAAVTRRWLDGAWEAAEPIDEREAALLAHAASVDEAMVIERGGKELFKPEEWRELEQRIYRKLLRDKRVVVQGAGKVGGAMLAELEPLGVNVVAVADAGGAIVGEHLDVRELLEAVRTSRAASVIGARRNVTRVIEGAVAGTEVLELACDILVPAALENTLTARNALHVQAKIVACGGNGTNSSKAERLLSDPKRGITVLYDFLANGGGVTASYFEWLRNLADRFRYEARVIKGEEFDPTLLDPYVMPEYRDRIQQILGRDESAETTEEWNALLRDIMFSAVNDDYTRSRDERVSMKCAGFTDSSFRVLAAIFVKSPRDRRRAMWDELPSRARERLARYLAHPEVRLHNADAAAVTAELVI